MNYFTSQIGSRVFRGVFFDYKVIDADFFIGGAKGLAEEGKSVVNFQDGKGGDAADNNV